MPRLGATELLRISLPVALLCAAMFYVVAFFVVWENRHKIRDFFNG